MDIIIPLPRRKINLEKINLKKSTSVRSEGRREGAWGMWEGVGEVGGGGGGGAGWVGVSVGIGALGVGAGGMGWELGD